MIWFMWACLSDDKPRTLTRDTSVVPVTEITKPPLSTERPPALNAEGLPNLVPLDPLFQGLEKGCTVSDPLKKWLESLASYQEEPPAWRVKSEQKGEWAGYFDSTKATIFQDYTKLEMLTTQTSYFSFGVSKVEYLLGHQNGISALSIWLLAPKKVVEPKIPIEPTKDPMLGTVQLMIKEAEDQTKLVCDWSN